MKRTNDTFTGIMENDFYNFFCGEELGSGMSRHVYIFRYDEDFVVKLETGLGVFQNILEWDIYSTAKSTNNKRLLRWLAKPVMISDYGRVLIMERTTPPPSDFRYPRQVPDFLTDLKRTNFGLNHDGKLVAHDYGTINCMLTQMGSNFGNKKANWYDE